MSSAIKRQAAEALATYLRTLPTLAGVPILVAEQDYEQDMVYPSVVLVPRRMQLEVFQDEELEDDQPDTVLVNIGDFEGDLEIRCAALGAPNREQLEQAVMDAFLASDTSPGVLVCLGAPVIVGGVQYVHQPVVSFVLDEEDWREEMVFDSERFSFITVDAGFPALVSRSARTIEQMISALNQDLNSDVPDEQRQVNADGTTVTL